MATCFRIRGCRSKGLNFYYKDFYDGIGERSVDAAFAAGGKSYRDRVQMVASRAEPSRWLDVGCGHGHFCSIARDVLPGTRFEGLDMSQSVEEAARRRWIDHGYRGLFPELAPELAEQYDVVSMHHYLEHTLDPTVELDAAAIALRSGGHLLIELPDPQSFLRHLGRFWMPYFQPQHLHLLSVPNLVRLLSERGFTAIELHRAEAHQPIDFLIAAILLVVASHRSRRRPALASPGPLVPSRLARLCVAAGRSARSPSRDRR